MCEIIQILVYFYAKTGPPAERGGGVGGTLFYSYFSYIVIFIFHMGILAQWDFKVLGLNSTDGLGWTRGQWDQTPL